MTEAISTPWHEKHKQKLFFLIFAVSILLMLLIMHPGWFN